jgi:hypothetical protein
VECATTNFAQIRRWWMRWPTANVGGAMGREMHLVALDFDPKNGGDLSLNDLLEAHGDDWLQTLTFKTGSGASTSSSSTRPHRYSVTRQGRSDRV